MGVGHGDDNYNSNNNYNNNNNNNNNNGSCDETNFSNSFTITTIFTIVVVSLPL